MNVEVAMEWLLAHSDDKDYNDPLPLDQDPSTTASTTDNNNTTELSQNTSPSTTSTEQDSNASTGTEARTLPVNETNSTDTAGVAGACGGGAGASGDGAGASGESQGAAAATSVEEKNYSPSEALQLFREFRNRPRKPPPETVSLFSFHLSTTSKHCTYLKMIIQ